jgi:hypothetical protein
MSGFWSKSSLLVALVAISALLGIVPSAQAATNLVPNPGFELSPTSCLPAPVCNWNHPGAYLSIAQDTTTFHTGAASMQVTCCIGPTGTFDSNISDCVNTPIAAGGHTGTGWWETGDPDTNLIEAGYAFFSGANCTGTLTEQDAVINPIIDSTWRQWTQALNVPAGTLSARFTVAVGVGVAGNIAVVNFDDLDMEDVTTAVTLSSLSATRTARGVAVRWHTASEAGLLGFNVYRERAGHRTKLTRTLIAANGRLAGARYAFVDRSPATGKVAYWLRAVRVDGTRTWYGPARPVAATAEG